jgi:hypothetical protein
VGQVLDHLPARHGTRAAYLGARAHVFIFRELLARRCALITAFRTTVTGGSGKGALPGRQRGGQLAALRAIDAGVHRLGVVFVSLDDQCRAVFKARVALRLTIGAGLGALVEVLGIRVALVGPSCRPSTRGVPA